MKEIFEEKKGEEGKKRKKESTSHSVVYRGRMLSKKYLPLT